MVGPQILQSGGLRANIPKCQQIKQPLDPQGLKITVWFIYTGPWVTESYGKTNGK